MASWSRIGLVAALSLSSGCAHSFGSSGASEHPYVECRDTLTCRVQAAERDRQFAAAVAAEPSVVRLDVESVAETVLLRRSRNLVYVLDPSLAALDLRTGDVRWRVDAEGSGLARVGNFLVVRAQHERAATFVFVDPDAPQARAADCTVRLPAPAEAETFGAWAFDRGGQPYVYWTSAWSYSGGTPPGPDALAREIAADACGVLRVDVTSCAAAPEALADFLFQPPEGRPPGMGGRPVCDYLSPGRDLPAFAASAPSPAASAVVTSDASTPPTLRVLQLETPLPTEPCRRTLRYVLEARDATAVLWTHALGEVIDSGRCPGPP